MAITRASQARDAGPIPVRRLLSVYIYTLNEWHLYLKWPQIGAISVYISTFDPIPIYIYTLNEASDYIYTLNWK